MGTVPNERSRPRHVLVIGASGELGRAVARHYAGVPHPNGLRLTLWGRDIARLNATADACRVANVEVSLRSVDLCAVPDAIAALQEEDDAHPINLAVFAAGLGDTRAPGDRVEDAAQVAQLATVNFTAPAALASTLADRMAGRGHGAIVLVGSAAAFHALPFAAAYSSTKAGLARFSEALRLGVRQYGVTVTLVSPGFIDTAAGRRNPGPRPFLMSPDAVAARMASAADRGQAHLVLPLPFTLLRLFDRILPRPLRDHVLLALTPPDRTG